ncbi:MAG: hypothetical protein J1E63_06830 [Muribaculaceae bacterium]|nr:hypothetical protein [Muribaculaceae bacterium]
MKKIISILIAFIIIWGVISGLSYIVGLIFDNAFLLNRSNVLIIGFSAACAGIFAPIFVALINRSFTNK